MLCSWPSTEPEAQRKLQLYWSFRDDIAVTDGIAITGRRIVIPDSLQDKQ